MQLQPENYPIDQVLPKIEAHLKNHSCLLLKAETGAGKTTRLPPYLCHKLGKRVLVLEPRRLAAILSAKRCAETLECSLGDKVGHHIRFDKRKSEKTDLLFITEGLFLHYLREDPQLSNFDIIVLDEFHERSIHTDLAMALIRRVQKQRDDLKLIIMSATLDTGHLESYLQDTAVMNIKGRTYPLHIEYKEDLSQRDAIFEMVNRKDCPHNILVFLPGVAAIKSLENLLKNRDLNGKKVHSLYSSLSKEDQEKIFQTDHPKIVLATNIAETSLTIPQVTGVIDIGLEKRASFASWSGMPLLLLEKISKASAIQRAGRAGRVQEGIVYRLYSEIDYTQRMTFTPPEIKRVDLSAYLLQLLSLSIPLESIEWFESPDEKNLLRSLDLLRILGATETNSEHELSEKLTAKGHFMANSPLHPRLSAMLWQQNLSEFPDLLVATSILSEGGIFNKASSFHEDDFETCDLTIQCNLLKSYYLKDKNLCDYSYNYLDKKKASRVKDLYFSLCRSSKLPAKWSSHKVDSSRLTSALLQGYPDRVAVNRKNSKPNSKRSRSPQRLLYNFCLGRGGQISPSSLLSHAAGKNIPELIIVLEALENPKANAAKGTMIHMASSLSLDQLFKSKNHGNTLFSFQKESLFDEKKRKLIIEERTYYGNLVLKKEATEHESPKGLVLKEIIQNNWPWPFTDTLELDLYHRKVELISKYIGNHPFCYFRNEFFELFIDSIIDEETDYRSLQERGLRQLIYDQLAPQDLYLLESLTPDKIKLNRKEFEIHYGDGDQVKPFIKAHFQDLYGINEHPRILTQLEESLPLQLCLLSPAARVAQIVSDLPNFWAGSWTEVSKELKSRYPKHYWPEDPANAKPIRLKKNI